jgi:hypothetical protein
MQTSPYTFLFVVIFSLSTVTKAFDVLTLKRLDPVAYRRRPSVLSMVQSENRDYDGDSFDIEAARRKLESIVGESDDGPRIYDEVKSTLSKSARSFQALFLSLEERSVPEAPPLTSIERERREAEIKMLLHLGHGDASLADLWTLWFQERGSKAAARLVQAEQLANNPSTWEEGEIALRVLIDSYGVHWVEPLNRLATLYYMQGKLKESEALCKAVLTVKPWHFGALSGIVMVYAGLHDVDEARQWAAHRLPSFAPTGSNRRREQWVQKAVREAQDSLLAAERRLQDSFGKRDHDIIDGTNNNYYNELDNKDYWQ